MSRERLRNRRRSESFTLELHGLHYLASFSRFDDGRVAEVFLQDHKPASQSDSNARDSAIEPASPCSLVVRSTFCGAPCCVTRTATHRRPSAPRSI